MSESLNLDPIPCYALTFSDEEQEAVFQACRERGLPEDLDGIKALVMEAAGTEPAGEPEEEIDLAETIRQYVSRNPERAAEMLERSGMMLKGMAGPMVKMFLNRMKKAG